MSLLLPPPVVLPRRLLWLMLLRLMACGERERTVPGEFRKLTALRLFQWMTASVLGEGPKSDGTPVLLHACYAVEIMNFLPVGPVQVSGYKMQSRTPR